ncbi:MAG: Nif3-like dinuclear metal center hexameric protein [Anaerotruncus sp.]|nr:Nif3-like dinuclear metal center hexameric protein [Anaerotruncus sp.]
MKVREIVTYIESVAPLSWQADYDSAGLQLGSLEKEITSCMICLDLTMSVLEEAIKEGCGLIITHHPLIFRPLKNLSGDNETEKLIIKALKEDIVVYSAHTNLDHIHQGVSYKMAEKLGLKNTRILKPLGGLLRKLVVFCPDIHLNDGRYIPELVRAAIFEAGAGVIGDYDSCSFNTTGMGLSKATSNPIHLLVLPVKW